MQASAKPNDCVKPNEQNRVYSNFAMASNRTFKNLFELCRAQPKVHIYYERLCKTPGKWLWRAVSPNVAHSPGQRPGKRRPRLIHSAFLRLRKNATRRKRVTHYALNATRGVAPHKAGCSYRARHFNQCNIVPPGRCPGLSAAIGLTARHTCAANAVKSCIYKKK